MAKREYVEANKRWLEEKAKEEGVMALPRGIYYKVLKQGDPKGAQPSRRSIVTAHYTGWTINGKKFDSSRGGTPFAMRLSDLIDGWIVAMQQMHVGDQWGISPALQCLWISAIIGAIFAFLIPVPKAWRH